MKYPDDFNTPAFPAGKFVAVSRFMGTAVSCIFFLIVCVCGIIFWVKRTQELSPFLIALNPNGERWTVVAHDNHSREIPAYYVLQESMLNRFVRYWFTISADENLNQARWAKCAVDAPECVGDSNTDSNTCAIYCMADENVWTSFENVVLPTFTEFAKTGDVWNVQSVSIKPVDSIKSVTQSGGFWKIDVVVQTATESLLFTGFARTEYNKNVFPKTMGYYVADFNMYRMN